MASLMFLVLKCCEKLNMRHAPFIARTVMVFDNNIEQAMRVLNSSMARDGLIDQYRRTRYYEKPCQMRSRINFQKCKAIYNEDMSRKLEFLMRVNRDNPYPGTC